MPVKPNPYKFVCSECGYTKVISPKSDVLNPMDLMSICPKCKAMMDKKSLNLLDNVFSLFK